MRWLARGEHEVPPDRNWLAPAEAARAAGMRFTKRRSEYLLSRWTAKQAVAAALGRPAEPGTLAGIEIRNALTGAPYLLVDGQVPGLEVSLSDRAGWAVCLVCDETGPIGCDLELVEPRTEGFVRDFLTETERAQVAAARDEREWYALANLIWSAKESALKVLRTGLRRDTRTVEVALDPGGGSAGWYRLSVRCGQGPVLPGWWRRDGEFLLTIAATRQTDPPVALGDPTVLASAVPVHSWLERPVEPDRAAES